MPKPQFPMIAVVTPSEGDGDREGSPGDLSVVMRVQVDDARHQREPASIDHLRGVVADLADRSDAAIPDRDIGADRVVPEPVD
jgi:hypothetical protein